LVFQVVSFLWGISTKHEAPKDLIASAYISSGIRGSAFLASEMCELEPGSESLTRSLLEGMEEKGVKGREGGKFK
jgi:hypothetical protein